MKFSPVIRFPGAFHEHAPRRVKMVIVSFQQQIPKNVCTKESLARINDAINSGLKDINSD